METKPINEAELWRQLEEVQAKMDAAIAERDAALARAEQAERITDDIVRLVDSLGELASKRAAEDLAPMSKHHWIGRQGAYAYLAGALRRMTGRDPLEGLL